MCVQALLTARQSLCVCGLCWVLLQHIYRLLKIGGRHRGSSVLCCSVGAVLLIGCEQVLHYVPSGMGDLNAVG